MTAIMLVAVPSLSLTAQSLLPVRQADFLFLRPISIAGEVNRQGTFPVIDSPTLAELIGMAGGLTGNAGATAILVHYSDAAPLAPLSRALLVELTRLGGARRPNITLTRIGVVGGRALDLRLPLEPQDILFVPSKNER